jgi:carbonic anhydrase
MDKLLAGMVRFQRDVYPGDRPLYEQLAREQQPETLFICCSDSRLVPHELTQTHPGELFICRNAGNIVPAHGDVLGGVSATVEYAVQVLKVRHAIVCGHSDCGAMRAVMHPERVQSYRAVANWIRHAERASAIAHELGPDLDDDATLDLLIEQNVIAQLHNLATHPCVAAKVRSGALQLHGMVFDIPSAQFRFLDPATEQFVSLDEMIARREEARALQGKGA